MPPLAVRVDILEQPLSGQILQRLDDPRQAPVAHTGAMHDAALALELEHDPLAAGLHMPVAQRGQPEAAVGPGVFVVADPDQGRLQQAHRGGDDLLLAEGVTAKIGLDLGADRRQGAAEGGHAGELGLVARRPPARVIAVLLAAPGVAAGGLDVAERVSANPDLFVGRRNGQFLDPGDHRRIGDQPAVRVDIDEAAVQSSSADARFVVVHIAKAGFEGGVEIGGRGIHLPKTPIGRIGLRRPQG